MNSIKTMRIEIVDSRVRIRILAFQFRLRSRASRVPRGRVSDSDYC